MNRLHKEKKEERLGNAIRSIRESKGFPSDWLAAKLGYADRSGYCKLERGEIKDISIWKIIDLCDLLECDLGELLELSGIELFETGKERLSETHISPASSFRPGM